MILVFINLFTYLKCMSNEVALNYNLYMLFSEGTAPVYLNINEWIMQCLYVIWMMNDVMDDE